MKKLITLLVAAIMSVACCFGLVGCDCGDKPIVGLITLHGESSTYDKNFIDAFKTACENKGLNEKQYTIVTDVEEGDACYSEAAKLVDNGCKAIFADSFGHGAYMIKAATEFTDVQFFHATGTGTSLSTAPANFHNAFASIYEGRYLAGYAAGLKLNTMKDKAVDNVFKVGYIGAYTYAEVISGYTSWFLGLQAALDEGYTATMEVQFTGSWYDEAAEKTAAETLINRGAVLVSQHADSMGAPTACDNAGVPNVAYNGTTNKNTLVAYSKINWVPYFEMVVDCALNGTEVKKDFTGSLADGSVQYAVGPAAAPETATKLAAIEKDLKDGKIQVFDVSKFTVEGVHLTSYLADVIDAKDDKGESTYEHETNVIKTEGGITFFSESTFRSAPYFDLTIDGISLLNTKF